MSLKDTTYDQASDDVIVDIINDVTAMLLMTESEGVDEAYTLALSDVLTILEEKRRDLYTKK